jgi:hypothetical protein
MAVHGKPIDANQPLGIGERPPEGRLVILRGIAVTTGAKLVAPIWQDQRTDPISSWSPTFYFAALSAEIRLGITYRHSGDIRPGAGHAGRAVPSSRATCKRPRNAWIKCGGLRPLFHE